ncbi:MAG: DUF5658 family protein [Gemmatimonadota bacterium]|jgi:hypothetical protein
MRILRNESLIIRIANRRMRPDRRQRHVLFSDWRWAWGGRRGRARRDDEAAEYGVDQYQPHLLVLAIGILILSCLDAAFTLTLLQRGVASEANPLMRLLIDHDRQVFVNLKVVLTGAAVIFMVALADWRFVRAVRVRHIMIVTLLMYGALVGYELFQYLATS